MSSPRRLWMGDSTGQPCGCHWSTAGSTETLQLDAGFGMHLPEEGSVCVSRSSSCFLPLFQGVHSGVIAKGMAASSWSQYDCRHLRGGRLPQHQWDRQSPPQKQHGDIIN